MLIIDKNRSYIFFTFINSDFQNYIITLYHFSQIVHIF